MEEQIFVPNDRSGKAYTVEIVPIKYNNLDKIAVAVLQTSGEGNPHAGNVMELIATELMRIKQNLDPRNTYFILVTIEQKGYAIYQNIRLFWGKGDSSRIARRPNSNYNTLDNGSEEDICENENNEEEMIENICREFDREYFKLHPEHAKYTNTHPVIPKK
jgi:hypothetical protein